MKIRFWDPKDEYAYCVIRTFQYWCVEISLRQHTLGTLMFFSYRNIRRISELSKVELLELQKVMKEIEGLYGSIPELRPDHWNYLQLGNNIDSHLHFHAVPRYLKPRYFYDKYWIDADPFHSPKWLKNVSTNLQSRSFVMAFHQLLITKSDKYGRTSE